jgi:hypothetical protein
MIKKCLTMSTGIVLGSLITTASFAWTPASEDCQDARADEHAVIQFIQSCKNPPPKGPWICNPPISHADASACQRVCAAVRQAICRHGSYPDPVPADSIYEECDNCIDSLMPLENVALNKAATQSSTSHGGVPMRAVDGNTDGNYGSSSITHTNNESEAWWEVDLGGVYDIDTIKVYNRTDCCSNRLSNFHVMVSNTPFPAGLAGAQNTADWSEHVADQAQQQNTFPVGVQGRYVRVQLVGSNSLSLAEVEVMGR